MRKQPIHGSIMLILILLTVRCTSDIPEPEIPRHQSKVVSIDEVPGLLNAIAPFINPSLSDRGNISSANTGDTYFGMDIDFDYIIASIDSSDYTNYSFLLDDQDGNKATFVNMVVGRDSTGHFKTPLLMQYKMTEEFAQRYYLTGSMEGFSGTITRAYMEPPSANSQQSGRTGDSEDPGDYGSDRDQPSVTCGRITNMNGGDPGANPGSGYSPGTTTYEVCEVILHTGTTVNPDGSYGTYHFFTYENCQEMTLPSFSSSDGNGDCGTPAGNVGINSPNDTEKPCKKNPVKDPEIAPQTISGTEGGMFGWTRNQGNKHHYGVDLKADYGDAIYAMYDGSIYSEKYDKDGAGYYTRIQSTVNGQTFLVEYHHLQKDNRVKSGNVKAGDIIGYLGDSGNLSGAIEDGFAISHVHIGVLEHDGSDKWGFKNYSFVDPLPYLATEIDSDGTVTKKADCD